MSKKNWLLNMCKTVSLVLFCGLLITACGTGSEKWKEEVQLSDGRVIVIERELVLERGGDEWAANRSLSKPKEYRIHFINPEGSGMIEWHSIKKSPQTWPEIPLVLDTESDKFLVISSVFDPRGCNVYYKYSYQDEKWIGEKLPPSFEQQTTNLFIFRDRDKQDYIDLAAKHKNISDIKSKHLSQVGPKNPDCSHL